MNYKNNGKMSYQLIYENHILLLHKLLRNNCFTLHLNGMPEELEPAVSINHHHTDEGPDISRQRYTSEHYTVMIQQLMCLPDIYIYFFFLNRSYNRKTCSLLNHTTIWQQEMERERWLFLIQMIILFICKQTGCIIRMFVIQENYFPV